VVFDCVGTRSTCDGVIADRAERWGPSALFVVVVWIVVSLVVGAIIDQVQAESDV